MAYGADHPRLVAALELRGTVSSSTLSRHESTWLLPLSKVEGTLM
jgi:hypothetical protein